MHAKSLRAIGQSLEILRVENFELETAGDNYIVRSESLSPTAQWIFRNSLVEKVWGSRLPNQKSKPSGNGSLCYEPADISWLDAQGQKKRRKQYDAPMVGAGKLSQLLRTVGGHLDRTEASVFKISWASNSVGVDYQPPGGDRERKDFSIEKLRELGLHVRFRGAGSGRDLGRTRENVRMGSRSSLRAKF
jgi:hypothetical protein